MGLTKPIEQYLFSNLLTKIHIVVYLKDIIRGGVYMELITFIISVMANVTSYLICKWLDGINNDN